VILEFDRLDVVTLLAAAPDDKSAREDLLRAGAGFALDDGARDFPGGGGRIGRQSGDRAARGSPQI